MKEKDIGKFIQQKRKEKNLTQQELGAKLFVTDKAVSKWERGLSLPDITLLGKLADILEVDIYDLLQIENKSQQINIEAILPIVVVLPTPLTPTNKTTVGPFSLK